MYSDLIRAEFKARRSEGLGKSGKIVVKRRVVDRGVATGVAQHVPLDLNGHEFTRSGHRFWVVESRSHPRPDQCHVGLADPAFTVLRGSQPLRLHQQPAQHQYPEDSVVSHCAICSPRMNHAPVDSSLPFYLKYPPVTPFISPFTGKLPGSVDKEQGAHACMDALKSLVVSGLSHPPLKRI